MLQPDADGGHLRTDIEPADMDEIAHRGIVCYGQEEFTLSRLQKCVIDAHPGKRI